MSLVIFTWNILAGEPIDVYNYGKHKRDFTYIDDIVEGVIRILGRCVEASTACLGSVQDSMLNDVPYRLYNIGNNSSIELMYFIEVLENCLGRKADKNLLPMQPGDAPDTYADIDDLVGEFGFKPNTAIEDGLALFVDWYLGYYKII